MLHFAYIYMYIRIYNTCHKDYKNYIKENIKRYNITGKLKRTCIYVHTYIFLYIYVVI